MFNDLKSAFRQAVDNFNKELNRSNVGGSVDALVREMVDEVAAAKARITELSVDLQRTRSELASEKQHAETCRRRQQLAEAVPDEETANIARDFARRHQERATILEAKAAALRAEIDSREREAAEMIARVQETRARRDALKATAGRTEARKTVTGDHLFEELRRMEENIEYGDHLAEAADAVGDLDSGPSYNTSVPPGVDAKLAELKRQMGR